MASEDRIEALRMRHAALESELKSENQRPSPDDAVVAGIKKEKLRLKDEMNRLAHV